MNTYTQPLDAMYCLATSKEALCLLLLAVAAAVVCVAAATAEFGLAVTACSRFGLS